MRYREIIIENILNDNGIINNMVILKYILPDMNKKMKGGIYLRL